MIALRAIPGMIVIRPADANEVVEAWRVIVGLQGRARLPGAERASRFPRSTAAATLRRRDWRAAAMFWPTPPTARPDVILIGTGSEVALCVAAAEALARPEYRGARRQHAVLGAVRPAGSKRIGDSVLPDAVKARVSVEAGSPRGWERYVGADGGMVGLDHFGASAPIKDLMNAFGFTVDNVVAAGRAQIAKWKQP